MRDGEENGMLLLRQLPCKITTKLSLIYPYLSAPKMGGLAKFQ